MRSGQTVATSAKMLGIARNTLNNWVKAETRGILTDAPVQSMDGENSEVSRLRAEVARVTMERDMLIKLAVHFTKVQL